MDKRRTSSTTSLWDGYINFIIQHRIVCLSIFLLIFVFLGYQLKNFQMADDPMASMYPVGHPYLQVMADIKAMAGEPSMVVGILEVPKGDIYNPRTIRKVDEITRALMAIDGITPTGITSLTRGIDHLNNSAEGFLPEPVLGARWPETEAEFKVLKQKLAVNAMGIGRYVSYDNKAVMITATLADMDQKAKTSYERLPEQEKQKLSLETYKKKEINAFCAYLLKEMRQIKKNTDDADHTFYFMGQEILMAQMTEMGKHHIPLAGIVMLLIAVVLLSAYFRTVQGVLMPLLSMILSIVFCLGIWAWQGMVLNPMALLFPLILGVLAMVFSVMFLQHYDQCCGNGRQKQQALSETFKTLPVASGLVTLGLVLGSLYAANVPMIKELGIMGLFWIVGAFVSVVFITPILISLFPAPGWDDNKRSSRSHIIPGARKTINNRKYGLWIVTAVILVAGVFCLTTIKIGGNVPGTSYIKQNHPWNQCFNKLSEKFIGPFQLLVYVRAKKEGDIADPDVINAIGDFSRYLIDTAGAKDCISIDMMIRMVRATLMDGNPKWQTIPTDKKQIAGLAGMVMSRGGVEGFMDKSLSRATISPFFPEKDAAHIDRYASMMQTYIDDHPIDKAEFFPGGGLLGMTKALNDGTRTSWRRVLTAEFIVVLLLAFWVTRSLLLGTALAVTLGLAQAGLCLIMRSFQIPVSLATIPALAAFIGFGAMSGYVMIQNRLETSEEFGQTAGRVIGLSLFVFACLLPWWFIGMTFQSRMMMILGLGVVIQGIVFVVVFPLLQDLAVQGREHVRRRT